MKRSRFNILNVIGNVGKVNKNKLLKKLIGVDGFVVVFDEIFWDYVICVFKLF